MRRQGCAPMPLGPRAPGHRQTELDEDVLYPAGPEQGERGDDPMQLKSLAGRGRVRQG
jgi:hypothetical protein